MLGSISIFLVEFQRRQRRRRRHRHKHGATASDDPPATQPPPEPLPRVDSLPDVDERVLSLLKQRASAMAAAHSSSEHRKQQELTCISEEGIADMDLPDALFEDIELELNLLQGDITSCNKVENYLVLSEYENNLIAEQPSDRRPGGQRRSVTRGLAAAQAAARRQADIPEEHGEIESESNSDASISSRLFRTFRRARRRDSEASRQLQ